LPQSARSEDAAAMVGLLLLPQKAIALLRAKL